MSPTQDQWPGPPRVLPPLMDGEFREWYYHVCIYNDATLEQITRTVCDLQRRRAELLYSDPPLAQEGAE